MVKASSRSVWLTRVSKWMDFRRRLGHGRGQVRRRGRARHGQYPIKTAMIAFVSGWNR